MKKFRLCPFTIILFFVFFSKFLAQSPNSMRIEGKAELLFSELIDKNIKDANGEVCAAIKIISNLEGLTYNSNNGIIKSSGKPGEDIIYLQPSEQIIIIYKTGFKPLRIVLNEIGIRLRSGTLWKIEVTGREVLIPVNIVVDQKDADLFIDGVMQERGINTFNIERGKHVITILKTGYKQINQEIDVSTEKTLFQYQLVKLNPVVVTVKTNPAEATVFWNEKEKDKKSNTEFFEIPGKYKIRVVKYGYMDTVEEVEVKENGKNEFTFDLRKNLSELMITINPTDAEIKINGKRFNAGLIDIEPGKHIIEVSKSLYTTMYDTLDIKLNQKYDRKYNLVKNSGYLALLVDPIDAEVFLNDQKQGDYSNIELADGIYFLRVGAYGYENITETIKIERGQRLEKKIELIPEIGKLQLTVQPVGAEVQIIKDDLVIRKFFGSQFIDSLLVGEYKIHAKNNDHISQTISIEIQKDQITVAEVSLRQGIISDVLVNNIYSDSEILKNLKITRDNEYYIINYDLLGNEKEDYEITLLLMDKSNHDYSYEVKYTEGDIGKGRFFGLGKMIKWNWKKEFGSGIDNNNLYMLLKVVKESSGMPWYVYVGGVIAGGVAYYFLKPASNQSNQTAVNIPMPPARP